jgi:hypothetical protein
MNSSMIRRLISKADAKLTRQRKSVEETEAELAMLIGQLDIAEKNEGQTKLELPSKDTNK